MIPAKSISYGGSRSLTSVRYIVIHYTGNAGDTARGNCNYFASGNTRHAGAHFFVSQNGDVCQSIALTRAAYAVGDKKYKGTTGGSYYGICKNANSVSIELCDNLKKTPSASQTAAVRSLIAYIRTQCPNAKTVIRHWDVSGKSCPGLMTGRNSSTWETFKAAITGSVSTSLDKSAESAKTSSSGQALAVDGIAGTQTVRQWQKVCGTPIDGVISGQASGLKKYHLNLTAVKYGSGGSTLIRRVQSLLGVTADGQIGQQTIKAIQSHLGCVPDGYFGPVTAQTLQEKLNSGSF